MTDQMKVFISWSGELSKKVAQCCAEWIGNVLQGVGTWISTEDVEKGSIWFSEIGDQLRDTKVGVICLTADNIGAPWILFEAGALSKGLPKNRVCTLLVDLSPSDVQAPLASFNATLPTKEDMLRLVRTVNAHAQTTPLDPKRLEAAFDTWWSNFEGKFKEILKGHKPHRAPAPRPVEDMVEEILEVTRNVQGVVQQLRAVAPVAMDADGPRWFQAPQAAPSETRATVNFPGGGVFRSPDDAGDNYRHELPGMSTGVGGPVGLRGGQRYVYSPTIAAQPPMGDGVKVIVKTDRPAVPAAPVAPAEVATLGKVQVEAASEPPIKESTPKPKTKKGRRR